MHVIQWALFVRQIPLYKISLSFGNFNNSHLRLTYGKCLTGGWWSGSPTLAYDKYALLQQALL